jgi:hypothetical protein
LIFHTETIFQKNCCAKNTADENKIQKNSQFGQNWIECKHSLFGVDWIRAVWRTVYAFDIVMGICLCDFVLVLVIVCL